jgi:hypothetical protein
MRSRLLFLAQAAVFSGLLLILLAVNLVDGARWPVVPLH